MRKYLKYKDSGVEWIGEIPEGWEVISLKRLCKVRRGASPRPIDDDKYFDDNGEYSWVRISDVSASERYLIQTEQKLSELGASLSVKMNPQDIFLSIAGSVGKPMITKIKCCIHDGFVWFDNLNYDKEFLYRIFDLGTCFSGLGKFGTQLNLNTDTISSIFVPDIPLQEQQQIVTYLDQKTTLIDQIISNSEKKIELLKEQRTATINHTVTKGLNPKVKMKDSGVEWIGEIPEGWECRLGTTIGDFFKGKGIRKDEVIESGNPCIRYGEIYTKYNHKVESVHSFISDDVSSTSIKVNGSHILLTGSGELASEIGKAVIVNLDEVYIGGDIIILKSGKDFDPYYLTYLINSESIRTQREISAKGEIVVHIYSKNFREMKFCCPSIQEQQQIVTYLDQKTKEIDDLISSEQKRIELLKEYRQSLISEVVTGKIMVN